MYKRQLDGRLSRKGDTWRYDDFKGVVGDSDMRGSAEVKLSGARPFLTAHLVSKRLDFDALAGFLGAAPPTGGGAASNADIQACPLYTPKCV